MRHTATKKKKGEKHTDALLRSMVLYKLGSFGDKETIKKAKELFGEQSSRASRTKIAYTKGAPEVVLQEVKLSEKELEIWEKEY